MKVCSNSETPVGLSSHRAHIYIEFLSKANLDVEHDSNHMRLTLQCLIFEIHFSNFRIQSLPSTLIEANWSIVIFIGSWRPLMAGISGSIRAYLPWGKLDPDFTGEQILERIVKCVWNDPLIEIREE